MRRAALLLVLPALLLAQAGCAGKKPDSEVVEPVAAPVTVEMKNLFALPIEVFVFGGGANFRLGVVHPGMSGQFKIPLNITAGTTVEFLLTANTKSVTPWRSATLLIAPGEVIDIVAAQRLFASTATIRP